jgi:hypothetical protein
VKLKIRSLKRRLLVGRLPRKRSMWDLRHFKLQLLDFHMKISRKESQGLTDDYEVVVPYDLMLAAEQV